MAYLLQETKIVPGGLNLLEPGDSPPQDESLDLTDWWPGAVGKLEQALEPSLVFTVGDWLDGVLRTGPTTYASGGNTVYVNGPTVFDAGYGYDYPVGMISFQKYAWFTSHLRQMKHNGSAFSAWALPSPPPAPTVTENVGGAAGEFMINDELTYYITWVIAGTGETNPSPAASVTMTEDLSSTSVTRPTTGIPAGVTGWNVYRSVGGVPYLMNIEVSPLPISTTFILDTGAGPHDDTGLLDFGVIMEANHDAPPAAAIMANQTYNGRIVVGNSVAHPNRIWWTQPFEPSYFRGAASENTGDWVDVGTDDKDDVRAIVVRPGMLVIYRAKSIWRHTGDLGDPNAVLEPACLDVGIAGARAVASTAAGDYFVGTGGDAVYRFNNDWPSKLSQKVEPVLRGLPSENYTQADITKANLCAVGHYRGRLYVSYTPVGLVLQHVNFILHIESGRWFAMSQVCRAFQDTGTSLLAATVDGLFELESGWGNGATHLAYQSQYIDCGHPDREKTFADLVVTRNTQGQNLSLTIRTNKNADPANDSMDLGFLNSTGLAKQIIPLLYPDAYPVVAKRNTPIRAFNLSVRITGTGFTTPQVIDSPLLLHYYLEARRAKTFDSGPTNHGLEGVGMIDQVELDIDTSTGPATLRISSDIPTGVMASRATVTIPQTSGRQVLRVQPTAAYGRLFRHQIGTGTTTDFQLYGYKVRVLPIGVYLDGTNPSGDFWYTGALAPGD
jgi:hypothetical protein